MTLSGPEVTTIRAGKVTTLIVSRTLPTAPTTQVVPYAVPVIVKPVCTIGASETGASVTIAGAQTESCTSVFTGLPAASRATA